MKTMIKDSFQTLGIINEMRGDEPDLVCLSHLRWDFVYQRPQHLLSRFARQRRVFFVEEPVFDDGELRLDVSRRDDGVYVVAPHLPNGSYDQQALDAIQREMIEELFHEHQIDRHILWYYTPMAVTWTSHLKPVATIYDCMDELSAFKGAPRALTDRESELLNRADLVFTGGQSLYEAKQHLHANIYPFPSSIDATHFVKARCINCDPEDQREIPHPRLGFFGVVDERMDMELLAGVADARPDWHLIVIGPVVKIAPTDLPQRANIHYLGGKPYSELPDYLAGWDVALLPFARNESTKFISPTKTPEYLSAGRPVVSTSIRDVVRPYGQLNLVRIADTVEEFVRACEEAMAEDAEKRMREVDAFLAETSWDRTWGRMSELIEDAIALHTATKTVAPHLPARERTINASRAAAAGVSASGD
jgi:UDP-galactopyranose mutase